MDKEVVVHTYSGISLSYKDCVWGSSNEVGESRGYYTKWSKSERGRQIPHVDAYLWNLEGWYWWAHLQVIRETRPQRTGLWPHWGKERVGRVDRGSDTHTILSETEPWGFAAWLGAQTGGLWQARGVGGRARVCTWGWFTLMYGRNPHDIVKQLSSNKK